MRTYLADTNIIIRYLIADDEEFFIKAKEIFDKTKDGQIHLIIETYIFTEVIYVLSSFYKVPKNKIVETMKELIAYRGVITKHEQIVKALEIYKNTNMHIVDCLLVAEAKIKQYAIASFDQELNSFVQKS